MSLRYILMSRKLCFCRRALMNGSQFFTKSFCTLPAFHNDAKHIKSWRHELPYSHILFRNTMDVPISGILHLTTACNTYIKSRYNEDEPDRKEFVVTIYAKGDQGVKIEDLQKIVDRINKFRNIVRYKFTGKPPLLRVDFPYLQKYRDEIQNCLAIVVEMPYLYGMVADVKERGNLCLQNFENEYTSGYTELGDIELSKIRTDYADCFSGRHIYCHDYIYGSGQFVCLQKGSIYMKNLQGVNFAMDGVDGNVETESVYCSDVVFTNEQGHVSTGVVQTTGCHVETHNGIINIDSLTADTFLGRIFKKGNIDVTVDKVRDFYIYHGEGGDVNVNIGPDVDCDLLVQSKTSSISSQIDFSSLEKYVDHIHKYTVTKGKLGDKCAPWKIENHHGHVTIEKGDWLRKLKLKIPNLDP